MSLFKNLFDKTRGMVGRVAGLLGRLFLGAASLAAYALRVFALTMITIDLLYGLVLTGLCMWIAADGSTTRAVLAAIVTVILVLILGVIVAVEVCALLTIKRLIDTAAIGKRVFDGLFDHVLGITDDRPGGDTAVTGTLSGLSIDQVRRRFNAAADELLSSDFLDGSLPGLLLWLSRRIQRIVVWGVARVIIANCTSDGDTIDLIAVRDRLAGVIDGLLEDWLRRHVAAFAWGAAGIVTALAGLMALGIRMLPL